MSNKVKYGLEQVHIAFMGVSQTESIEITDPCNTDGEITVTVTASTLLDVASPVDVIVPLAAETHNTVKRVASTIVNALNNNSDIVAVFTARHEAGVIKLATKVVKANDGTLNITITAGTTGVVAGTSTVVVAGTTSWGVPQAIPGAVKFSSSPEGGENKFYADNTVYHTHVTNSGYTGDLEVAMIPNSILAEMLGLTVDANGMLVEKPDAVGKEFALMGQVQGDSKNRRFVYYRCKATRPSQESGTTVDTTAPATDTVSLTMLALDNGGDKLIKGVMELSDTNAASYNAFFNAVTLPV